MRVEQYLKDLEAKMEGTPDQVREGIEIYLGVWRKAIERGVVEPSDEISTALSKVEKAGGFRDLLRA